jgi:hypothetical protein
MGGKAVFSKGIKKFLIYKNTETKPSYTVNRYSNWHIMVTAKSPVGLQLKRQVSSNS